METYPVDLEASQIVRWLIEEQRRGTLQLNVMATRSYVVEALEKADLDQIGEEGEDLSDILAIGMLEVSPPAAKDGWVLRIRVEDRIGRGCARRRRGTRSSDLRSGFYRARVRHRRGLSRSRRRASQSEVYKTLQPYAS